MSLFLGVREVPCLPVPPPYGASFRFPVTRTQPQFTHIIFNRYPARSIAEVPRGLIRFALARNLRGSRLRVLDPFCGSGTTAVEALLAGAEAYGIEADPFARLIATSRTTRFTEPGLRRAETTVNRISKLLESKQGPIAELPDLPNLEHWFSVENILALRRLRGLIEQFAENRQQKNFLLASMAEIIRPCSYAERQTLKPYVSRRFPKQPAKVTDAWRSYSIRNLQAMAAFSKAVPENTEPITWLGDDATDFRTRARIDLAITSPPYINALDYVRCTKFESAWLGVTDQASRAALRTKLVGEASRVLVNSIPRFGSTELDELVGKIAQRDAARAGVVRAYFNDLAKNLSFIHKVLRPGGMYWIIVGENQIRGVQISTPLILVSMASSFGFVSTHLFRYILRDHRTSIPRNGRGGKIAFEYVLGLRKEN